MEMHPNKLVEDLIQKYSGQVVVADFLCDEKPAEGIGLYYKDSSGNEKEYTFKELQEMSVKFAGVLQSMNIKKGDRVAGLLPKTLELLVTTLAVWRLGAVYVPLFTAFGPEAVSYRIKDSGSKVAITDTVNRYKVENLEKDEDLKIITVENNVDTFNESVKSSFWPLLKAATPFNSKVVTSGDDLLILLYTSGTTGSPKGVEVPVKALASMEAYMHFGLDVREHDVFWNMADPGWAYGLYYGLIGALLLGKPVLFFNSAFDANSILEVLKSYRITNFASAPTAYRAMRASGKFKNASNVLSLRVASSAGEPLTSEVNDWADECLGIKIHDQYGQTELGMVVNNHHTPVLKRELRLGSMGFAMPGFRVVVLDDSGRELEEKKEGILAIDTHNSPLFWFRGYYKDLKRTKENLTENGRYYLTGDLASLDEDGYFYFSSRADDVILTAGYRVGPHEVENALMKHEAVMDVAVIGKPDDIKGAVIKAFVVLKSGYAPKKELEDELCKFVKTSFSAHAYPREVEFVQEIPKTPSGKKQRFLLKG